jgi:steroid delta-isomerase-like uncharacterized protein
MSNDARIVWQHYIDAWNSHDVDKILACTSETFVYDEVPMTMHKPIEGQMQFRKYLIRVLSLAPDLHITVLSLDEGTDFGFSESVMTGTLSVGKGVLKIERKITAKVACRFDVADGKLVREHLYWDKGNTLRQVGILASLVAMLSKEAWTPDLRIQHRIQTAKLLTQA